MGSAGIRLQPRTDPPFQQPSDHSLLGWSYDPVNAVNTTTTVNGTLYLAEVQLRQAAVVGTVWFMVSSAGSGATAGQNRAGLYNRAGTLLSSGSADTAVTAAGAQSVTLAAAQTLDPGAYWVAVLVNATGAPALARATGTSLPGVSVGRTAATFRYATNGTSLTALPSSITPSSNSTTGASTLWVAVS